MSIRVEAINHVGLVVRDRAAAERFYIDILGFRPHHARPTWLVLNATSTMHLIPLPGADDGDSRRHAYQHVALRVPDLRAVLRRLLDHDVGVFQADFNGERKSVTSPDDPLDFGVGSLFVRDPDGNMIEFLQIGHGLFTRDMTPRCEA
jgi:catechol 2,3-dioxygenase-like lactoylglutathione lyase family enzyme